MMHYLSLLILSAAAAARHLLRRERRSCGPYKAGEEPPATTKSSGSAWWWSRARVVSSSSAVKPAVRSARGTAAARASHAPHWLVRRSCVVPAAARARCLVSCRRQCARHTPLLLLLLLGSTIIHRMGHHSRIWFPIQTTKKMSVKFFHPFYFRFKSGCIQMFFKHWFFRVLFSKLPKISRLFLNIIREKL